MVPAWLAALPGVAVIVLLVVLVLERRAADGRVLQLVADQRAERATIAEEHREQVDKLVNGLVAKDGRDLFRLEQPTVTKRVPRDPDAERRPVPHGLG